MDARMGEWMHDFMDDEYGKLLRFHITGHPIPPMTDMSHRRKAMDTNTIKK